MLTLTLGSAEMFFQVDSSTHDFIENSQYQSINALGGNPKDFLYKTKNDNKSVPINGNFDPQQLSALKKEYEKIGREGYYMIVPEYHYETSFDYYKFLHSCNVTKYDNPNFLARFTNLIPLCHDVFTEGNKSNRKNIILTSLPFLNMNGVCAKYNEGTDIVFLNEGLLSIIPKIYRYLLPLCDQELFGSPKGGENLMEIVGLLLSSQFLKSSYNKIITNPDIAEPSAGEKWYLFAMLQKHIEKNIKSDSSNWQDASMFKGHPSNIPYSSKMGQFYACRGAFTFLLGHEFSHAYNDHCSIKKIDDLNLRADDFFDLLDGDIKKQLLKFEDLSPLNRNFCVYQPIEEEADSHGLHCVAKYCADNNLDEQRTICTFAGAISVFIVMEIHEHLTMFHSLGSRGVKEYLDIYPLVRNMLFRGEHPTPITRLTMALNHEQYIDSPMTNILHNMNENIIKVCESISSILLKSSDELEQHLKSSEMLNVDLTSIFSEQSSLGAADISGVYLSQIKNSFPRKKSAQIINLFGNR